MDNFERDIDDILNLTDSDDSSSSSNTGIFETKPLVLELHELKKNEPAKDTVNPVTKTKRKRKRSHLPAEARSGSSSSTDVSDSVPKITDAIGKEEFYDANGSFHEITEDNQVRPVATATLAQAHSEISQNPKLNPEQTNQSQRTSATPRQPSNTITKPVAPPE